MIIEVSKISLKKFSVIYSNIYDITFSLSILKKYISN